MASIARKNLLEDIPRFLVAQAGIMFAVSLVTIQTGILNGFTRSTSLLIDNSTADLWVASEKIVYFEVTDPLIANHLDQVRQVPGVSQAEPLIIGSGRWYPPQGDSSPLRIIGFNPQSSLFQPGTPIQGNFSDVQEPYGVMVDKVRLPSLEVSEIGAIARIDSLPTRVVAITEGTQSIVASTFLFTSIENANTYINAGFKSKLDCRVEAGGDLKCTSVYEKKPSTLPQTLENAPAPKPLDLTDPITYVLVKAQPDTDIFTLQQRLEDTIPGIRVFTTAQMSHQTRTYWQSRTSLGLVLGLGAVVGVVVGIVVVAQILYSSVSDHIKEFGTLKAMGAPDRVIYGIIVEQALWMAILGYIPGLLLCWGVSLWIVEQGIIILITPGSALTVLGITVLMCVSSAFFAIQKVTRIDPAIVFKA